MHGQLSSVLPCHYASSLDSIQLLSLLKSGKIATRPSYLTNHIMIESLHNDDDQNYVSIEPIFQTKKVPPATKRTPMH